jgi:hypothetical protein
MSGAVGSGAKGECGPLPPAPPRRPRARTGFARAAGERNAPGGRGCVHAAWGAGGEELCACNRSGRPSTAGPPAGGGCARLRCRRSTTPARRVRGRRRHAGASTPRRAWVVQHAGRRVGRRQPGLVCRRRRVPHRRSTSSSRPSSSPRVARPPVRPRTHRSSSTPRSRCPVRPARSTAPASCWSRAVSRRRSSRAPRGAAPRGRSVPGRGRRRRRWRLRRGAGAGARRVRHGGAVSRSPARRRSSRRRRGRSRRRRRLAHRRAASSWAAGGALIRRAGRGATAP